MKRVKMEEKLLWRAYRNSPTLFRTLPSTTPYGLPFLEIGGFLLSYPSYSLISGTCKATDLKFGVYIYMTNPNKSPLNFLKKMERIGISRDCPILGVRIPTIISETGKATDFKFCKNIHRVDRTKAHENVGKCRGRSQGVPKIFSAPICKAHCAVIFAIAQLSCLVSARWFQ